MSICEWIYLIVVEGIKVLLVGHYFFGYDWNKKKTKFLLCLYFVLALVVEDLGYVNVLYIMEYLWKIAVVLCLFKGRVLEKVRVSFVICFLVAFVDAVIGVPFIMVFNLKETDVAVKMIIGCLGGCLLGILGWKAKSLQRHMQEFWNSIAFWEYLILLLVLWLLSMILGGMQGYLYDVITTPKRELVYIFGVIAVIVFLLFYLWLFYARRSKERLEEVYRYNSDFWEVQKKYYESSLKQYEDMRGFRHDINNHLYILSELGREGKDAELKEYIERMTESYDKAKVIHTGNFVADCIISNVVQELQAEAHFSFQIDGHFPEKFPMEDIDFVILLSNILSNAVEALAKEERKLLQIEVKRYEEWLYLIVANNTTKETIDFSYSSKQEANHGYGISNVRRVVEKYNGTVHWCVEHGMVKVKVKLKFKIN